MDSNDPIKRLHEIADQRRKLVESLCSFDQGLEWCYRNTDLVDLAIQESLCSLFEATAYNSDLPLAVIATGGYARRELAPYSDADLSVVTSSQVGPELDSLIRQIFTVLSEQIEPVLEIKVSYAYRLLSDIEGLDPISRSALLDIRLLSGSESLFHQLRREMVKTHPHGEFLAEKLEERRLQLHKTHQTPLVSEPNLKDGAGGVRDFHTVNWIRETLGEARLNPTREFDFVIATRNLLHKVSERKSDLLNRSRQSEIADLTGLSSTEFYPRLVSSTELLSRSFQNAVERIPNASFRISKGVYARNGEVWIEPGTEAGIASVGVALASRLGIKVTDFSTGCSEATNGPAFLYAISNGLPTLKDLDRCGLLKLVLPELEACRYLLVADAIHDFTVFQHSIQVVENLFEVIQRPWLREVYDQIADDGVLVLSALLHDLGKLDPSTDHSETGATVASKIATRLNLYPDQASLTEWLVRNHLVMDQFMRFRDLDAATTIGEFRSLVPSLDALNHLTLLTIADASAVSPSVWNPSQETFLRTLYERTVEAFDQEVPMEVDPSVSRRNIQRSLQNSDIPKSEIQELVDQLPAYYLATTPLESVRAHVSYVRKAKEGQISLETYDRTDIAATEFTICAADQSGLLSQILGVFYAHDLSITDIRACTTTSDPPIALDIVTGRFGNQCVPPGTRKQIASSLIGIIQGSVSLEEVLRSRGKDPNRQVEILEWQLYEADPARLEIRSPRGRGLPFRLSRWISEQGWNIQSARIGQWAGKAAATFYIANSEGLVNQATVDTSVQCLRVK